MGKDIKRIYKHGQSKISTLSPKTPVSSSSEPQTSSAIELKITSVPYVTYKHQKILFCIPKIPSIMMQPSQIMRTYSLVRQQENNIIELQPFQHLIIINNILLPHPQVD